MTDAPVHPDSSAQSRRVFLSFGLISLATAPLFALAYWTLGGRKSVLALLAAVPFLASSFLVHRLTRSAVLAGNWILLVGYALFAALALFTDGIDAPALSWSACIPLIGAFMCGTRSGVVWLVLVLLKFSYFYWMEAAGHRFEQEFSSARNVETAYFLTACGLAAFAFALGAVSEFYKNRYLKDVERSRAELQAALEKVKTLKGLLPICAWCKKVRDDKGYWDQVEVYFGKHSEAEFSHGICPDCEKRLVTREPEI